jgi:hypothetical protein
MNEKKFRFSIPGLSLQIPGISKLRLPLPGGLYLGGGRLIVASLSTVVLGFLAATFLLISTGDQEITWPMVGASYDALNMPANIRIDVISFTNVSLGKSGITDAFQLTGTSTADVITIDTLIIRNSDFPTMDWANGNIYTLHATSSVVAAGHTFSPTMSSSTNDVVIGSGRGATSYIAKDMVVDRIILQQTTTGGDVIIGTMILDGVRAWTGGFNADYFEIGRLILENVRIGDDGDIDSADLILHSSVSVNTVYDGVVEEPVFIR